MSEVANNDVRLVCGDSRSLDLPDASVDAIVCDPPYELGFMGKKWDKAGVAFDPATWAEALRVLKDGGRMLAFGGSRTHHRIWCAIEDAGFVIEDTMMWLYGSGFPKHKSKLKPAFEPICVARKGGTSLLNIDECRIAGDVRTMRSGTGGHVYGSGKGLRVAAQDFTPHNAGRWPANIVLDEEAAAMLDEQSGFLKSGQLLTHHKRSGKGLNGSGTFEIRDRTGEPCNFGGDSGGASRFFYTAKASRSEREAGCEHLQKKAGGSTAKGFTEDVANGQDRNHPVANHHPTVKPISLMRWLVRLVTKKGDLVLDPFTGSGSTGIACALEGRTFIGYDLNPEYIEIAKARIAHWSKRAVDVKTGSKIVHSNSISKMLGL